MSGYLKKGVQAPMAQGRSTKITSRIKWIRTSRLSIMNARSSGGRAGEGNVQHREEVAAKALEESATENKPLAMRHKRKK